MRSNAKQVIGKLKMRLSKVMQEAPKVLANEGQRYFSEQFRKQQFDNDKWPEVKRRIPGTYEYKYPKRKFLSRHTNPILVGKTRRLKNAVNKSIRETSLKRIRWTVSVPYADRHNRGLDGMPKRQFMGASRGFKIRLKNKFDTMFRSAKYK